MKLFTLITLCFLCSFCLGQQLHHQMLLNQGGNYTINKSLTVRQSIGQMSSIGNYNNPKITIEQGFQQSLISELLSTYNLNSILTTIYPNPFNDVLNVSFSKIFDTDVSVSVYNIYGVPIFSQIYISPINTLNFNLEHYPSGTYVIHITSKNYSYSKTVIKL